MGDLNTDSSGQTPLTPGSSPGFPKRLRLALILLAVVAVILGALALARKPAGNSSPITSKPDPKVLSITSTVPDLATVANTTPSMAVIFNLPLESGSASVTSDPQIISSTSIKGNTLTIIFTPRTLLNAKTYTITIKGLNSTTGVHLTDPKTLTFVATSNPPTTSGQEALSSVGLSEDQVNSIYTYLSQFNLWAQNIAVDPASVRHFRENPSDAWSPWAVGFTVNIDGTAYKAVTDYYDTEHIRIKLNNLANQQVYTAGDPGSY
jgi:hypothetical protein